MSFRLAHGKSLFLAGLILAGGEAVQAQTNGLGQQIVFSTPEGQIASNSTVPLTEAPHPREMMDLPAEAPVSFDPQMPQPVFATPSPMIMSQINPARNIDPLDPMNPQKTLKAPTAAQIMGVQTVRQIFGLPDSANQNQQKNPALALIGNKNSDTSTTNIISSDESSAEDPTWAKILAENEDQNLPGSTRTTKSHSLMEGFFSGPPSDDSLFGNQDKNAAANGFGPSQPDNTVADSSAFNSSLAGSALGSSLSTPAMPEATANTALSAPSPFTLPQNSGLSTLPQLPTAQSLPGQNYNVSPPPPPSWEPKPAPWLSPVPPAGTMEPRKF
jgi:hypothetical protein